MKLFRRFGFPSVLALALTLTLTLTASAETRVFTDTVRVVMGSRESQDEVRVYATQEAKRRVLEQVGVYLSGSTEILRKVQESFGSRVGQVSKPAEDAVGQGSVRQVSKPVSENTQTAGLETCPTGSFSDTTSVLQRIQTLTVGVVQTEVTSEEWKTEFCHTGESRYPVIVLYLVCRVKVDPDDALKRLSDLLQDKQKVEDYQRVQ